MTRALLTALLLCSTTPLAAQDAAEPAAEAAPALSPEQVTAFNAAVADFTAGQKAQQAGDNAGAVAKYDAALPAIRDVVRAQPQNIDNVNFLANALYAAAAANAALQKIDAVFPLYEESVPHWRTVVAAKPEDATSRNILAGILVQLGNVKLSRQDKAGAAPLYGEAATLARKSVQASADAANRNLLLGALIGMSQTGDDPAIKAEVAAMSKTMLADGTVDAANKAAAQILSEAASD